MEQHHFNHLNTWILFYSLLHSTQLPKDSTTYSSITLSHMCMSLLFDYFAWWQFTGCSVKQTNLKQTSSWKRVCNLNFSRWKFHKVNLCHVSWLVTIKWKFVVLYNLYYLDFSYLKCIHFNSLNILLIKCNDCHGAWKKGEWVI